MKWLGKARLKAGTKQSASTRFSPSLHHVSITATSGEHVKGRLSSHHLLRGFGSAGKLENLFLRHPKKHFTPCYFRLSSVASSKPANTARGIQHTNWLRSGMEPNMGNFWRLSGIAGTTNDLWEVRNCSNWERNFPKFNYDIRISYPIS